MLPLIFILINNMASPFSDDEMWSDDDFADSGDESYVDKHTEKAPQEDSKPKISKHILQLQQRLGIYFKIL